jgi:hypothetical protein
VRSVVIEDEFGTKSTVTLDRPSLVCAPVEVTRHIRNRIDRLVCYEISGRSGPSREVSVDNELFDPQTLAVAKPQLLCVPSVQTP